MGKGAIDVITLIGEIALTAIIDPASTRTSSYHSGRGRCQHQLLWLCLLLLVHVIVPLAWPAPEFAQQLLPLPDVAAIVISLCVACCGSELCYENARTESTEWPIPE